MLRRNRKPDLYACPTEDGAIVLDLNAERYYTLANCDAFGSTDTRFFDSHGIRIACSAIDLEALSSVESTPSSPVTTVICLFALLRATLYVALVQKMGGAKAVIHHLKHLKRAREPGSLPAAPRFTLPSLTHAFRRLRPFLYTARDNCLFDAMVLATYLLALGIDAVFVVAVRTQPFQAHAWTQSGNYLVDDYPEKVQLFTPILVV